IQALGTGVDGIADQPDLPADVTVTSMRGIHGPQMAEMAILMMLSHARHLPWSIRNQDKARYARRPGRLLEGKTVGILGVGVIADALAARLRPFGTRVVGITTRPRDLPDYDAIVTRVDLVQVVGEFDFLVVLIPYTADTEKIINAEVLAAMKPDAYLVNLARGEVIDDDALIAALEADRIGGAALDVFWEEPLPADHPYWTTKNVLITPHHGGMVEEYGDQAIPLITHNMRCFLSGKIDAMRNIIEH
ncbi:MAG: D-2-hydroxyacid dehydrogenase, partial [Proteobacteria bacterium]|nr:D-2-hydroxyacid dehydrogenase [Pseudomonadota bacterium]